MKFINYFLKFLYELMVSFLHSLVGYKRSRESFERKKEVFRPWIEFLNKTFHIKIKLNEYKEGKRKSLSYSIISLSFIILLILLVRYSVIEPYKIPSGSMIPTLKIGDHVFVNKLSYGLRLPFIGEITSWNEPKRGQIVVFYPPLDNGKIYVKRLIGLPGDLIKIDDTSLYINGKLIEKEKIPFYPEMEDVTEPEVYNKDDYNLFMENLKGVKHYVLEVKDRSRLYYKFNLEIKVPKGHYFFMGDNRDHSEDSRVWGLARKDDIRGKPLFIWLSFNWNKMFSLEWFRFSRLGISF
jgi:signal peptidase I